MTDLASKKCVPCAGGVPPLDQETARDYLKELKSGWHITMGGKKLTRKFKFKNFREALAFTNQIGELAEKENHHPNLELG